MNNPAAYALALSLFRDSSLYHDAIIDRLIAEGVEEHTATRLAGKAGAAYVDSMTPAQRKLATLCPDRNPVHMERLAVMVGSCIDDMPDAFFQEIATLAAGMTPARLQEFTA